MSKTKEGKGNRKCEGKVKEEERKLKDFTLPIFPSTIYYT
jgi:hypothetical protein